MGGTEPTDSPDLIVCIGGHADIRHAADGAFTIGRDGPPSDVSIAHPAVSRLHSRLIPGKPWHLVDYESLNGIYVEGARIEQSTAITDGMTVHLANPQGVAITFYYVNSEDITAPSPATLAARDAAGAAELTEDSFTRATAQLRAVISDIMRLPQPTDRGFARVTLGLLQRLMQLRGELEALAAAGEHPEAAGYLTCVQVMYDALVIRMSAAG